MMGLVHIGHFPVSWYRKAGVGMAAGKLNQARIRSVFEQAFLLFGLILPLPFFIKENRNKHRQQY
jgi:hypothetical protein